MATTKVAITINSILLAELDSLVAQRVFPNRSRAIQAALEEKLTRLHHTRLARECAKLNPVEEQSFAVEGMEQEFQT